MKNPHTHKLSQEKISSLFCYQFAFNSVNHALTSLTELIGKALDENKFEWGVITDLQNTFDTVNHNILLSMLYHNGVKRAPHEWFI